MKNRHQLTEELINNFMAMRRKMFTTKQSFAGNCHITPAQGQLFFLISRHDGIGIKEVAEHLSVSNSAATQLVDGLVALGYIVREVSPNDGRALKLHLSEEGKNKHRLVCRQHLEKMSNFFEILTDEELLQLHQISQKIADHICVKND